MARKIQSPVRVLLVDDHALLRQHVRGFLGAYPTIEVIGEAADGEDALRAVHRLSPDVVVMDIHMPRLNGIAATARIKQADPGVAVVGLSMSADSYQDEMLAAGAAAVVSKEDLVKRLPETIHLSIGLGPRSEEVQPTRAEPAPVWHSRQAR
jgi:DNA-binding NarL/FixJ family response regulator